MGRLNEHLWSGIIHRSETGEVRKEDDVDLLDIEQFQEYLNDHYEIFGRNEVSCSNSKRTSIFIFLYRGAYDTAYICTPTTNIEYYFDGTLPSYILENTLSNEFKNKYIMHKSEFSNRYKTNIKTNTDVLHFIDDFIKMPKPDDFDNEKMIKKVKN